MIRMFLTCVPKSSSGNDIGHRNFYLTKQYYGQLCAEPFLRHDKLLSKLFSHVTWYKKVVRPIVE